MKRRYRSILLRVALLSFVLYSAVKIIGLQIEIYQKRETVREIEQQIEQQQLRNAALQDMLDEGMSEEMVKKIAREKLGLLGADERIFINVTGD
ncbi:septum formation initiator family protein [Feifania hominis]|uniref:Septum formation initiator family protein n=1 Tax=Feifania hominis TaxID=2763660 RepID=A0A926HQW2_9FIRM|nr:septum formation initiator family protein [Feifania hominis]MBC8536777.1 septum formation initiator family protein [Feifania hominis]